VSSVESWFFSSFGWNVPIPTRSFSESRRRRTRTCSTTFVQSPWWRSIRIRKKWRLTGSSSPWIDRRYSRLLPRFRRSSTDARASSGTSSSGSWFIGEGVTSPSIVQSKVYSAPASVFA
jgi:hypothetical protein